MSGSNMNLANSKTKDAVQYSKDTTKHTFLMLLFSWIRILETYSQEILLLMAIFILVVNIFHSLTSQPSITWKWKKYIQKTWVVINTGS